MPTSDSTPHFSLSRAALTNYILLFFGTALTLAGIIFFFAYNWDALPDLAKLGTIQVGFIACALGATITPKRPVLSQTFLFAASIFVGVYLAVFGQIYQTGADPWQLFTLWAALIIPFALIAKNQTQWITFATIAAIGTGRFLYFFVPEKFLSGPLGFTIQILIPSLFFAAIWLKFERDHRIHNLPKPWSRPLLALIIFAVLTLGTAVSSHSLGEASNIIFTAAFYALLAATTLGAWRFFGRSKPDVTILGIAALAWLVSTTATLIFFAMDRDFDVKLTLFAMAIYLVAASSFLVSIIRKSIANNPSHSPEPPSSPDLAYVSPKSPDPTDTHYDPNPFEFESESPRILSILSGFAGWLAAALFMSAVVCTTGADPSRLTLYTLALVLTLLVIGAEFGTRNHETLRNNAFLDQIINAFSLSAQLFAIVALITLSEDYKTSYVPILGIALVCAIHYIFIRSKTLRFITTATFLSACVSYLYLVRGLIDVTAITLPTAIFSALFFIAIPYTKQTSRNAILPAAYAAVIAVSLIYWFPVSTGSLIIATPIALAALASAVSENRHNPDAKRLLIAATVLAALSFFADPTLLWAFTLVAVGLWRQRTPLTALGIVGFAFSLSIYYYNLNVTLLTKSGILLATGLLFLALFWFLELNKNKNNTNTTSLEVNP